MYHLFSFDENIEGLINLILGLITIVFKNFFKAIESLGELKGWLMFPPIHTRGTS